MVPGEGVEPSRACAQRFLSSPEARHHRSPSVTSGASSATWTHRRLRPFDTWCHLEAHGVGTKLTHSPFSSPLESRFHTPDASDGRTGRSRCQHGFESPTGSAHGTSYCLRGASPCRLAAIKDQSRRRDGQCEPAHEHVTIATTMYREMDMSFWLARADSELTLGATSWVISG